MRLPIPSRDVDNTICFLLCAAVFYAILGLLCHPGWKAASILVALVMATNTYPAYREWAIRRNGGEE